jgi:hypothetical protein
VQSFRTEFDAEMYRKPGTAPMVSTSVKYNFVASPTRLFFMKSRMFGLPVQVLHDYAAEQVTFSNGPHRVSATLYFNERDELVDFTSDDRPQLLDGRYRPYRWSTPIEDYRQLDGLRLPTRGAAVYAYPEDPFTYGKFRLKSVAYSVEAP